MRILYVARHGIAGGMDDEGAITYSLRKLGHTVTLRGEDEFEAIEEELEKGHDLLLFHKWEREPFARDRLLNKFKDKILRAFWYFDLVNSNDHSLSSRDYARGEWARRAIAVTDIGFFTDGEFVKRFHIYTAKDKIDMFWLMQGFDERLVDNFLPAPTIKEILFTGNSNGGRARKAFVEQLRNWYPTQFNHISSGLYRKEFVEAARRSFVNVSPDFPIEERYWSNRIYNVLGAGGLLAHPYSNEFNYRFSYIPDIHFLGYSSRNELRTLIDRIMKEDKLNEDYLRMRQEANTYTIRNHLYTHRCEMLIDYCTSHVSRNYFRTGVYQ